jgi:hypothetical protein
MGRPIGAHVRGPLQPLARGFLLWLIELGYSWTAQTARLRLLSELSSWMAARGVEAGELTAALMTEFLDGARVLCLGAQWCSPTSERQVLPFDSFARCGLRLVVRRRRRGRKRRRDFLTQHGIAR